MVWGCVMTKPASEMRAHDMLKSQGFYVFLPMLWEERWARQGHKGRKVPSRVVMFPRYLFVKLFEDEGWSSINDTRGVSAVLTHADGGLQCVPEPVIADIQAEHEASAAKARPRPSRFAVQQQVRIVAGPFTGLSGIVEATAQDRVRLLLDILGAHRQMSVPETILGAP